MGVVAAEAVEVAAEAVEVAVEAVVVEERRCLDPEEQDRERLSPHMWITNYMAKALTSLQGTSRRPENSLPSGTSTGVSTSTPQ